MHCAALLLAFVALASARPHSPARAGDACEPRTIFCADGDGRSARFLKCVRGRLIEGFCTQNSVCVGSKGTTLFCAADDTSGTGATTSTTTVVEPTTTITIHIQSSQLWHNAKMEPSFVLATRTASAHSAASSPHPALPAPGYPHREGAPLPTHNHESAGCTARTAYTDHVHFLAHVTSSAARLPPALQSQIPPATQSHAIQSLTPHATQSLAPHATRSLAPHTTQSPTPPAMQSQPGSQPDSQPDAAAESEDPEDSEESEEPEEPRAQSTPPGMFRAAQPSSTASKHHPTVAEDAVLDIPPAATGAEKENVLEAGQVVPIIASVIFSQHPELFDHGASASRPAATPPLPPVHQTAAPRKGIDTCRPGSFFCADHGAQPGYFACDAVGLPLPASCGANNVCYQFGRSILCDKVGRTAHVDGMFA